MTSWARLCLLVLLAFGFAFSKDKAPLTDDSIHDQVLMKLAGDVDVKGGGIDVEVHNGAVTLKGKVEKDKQREKAERLVKKIKGVSSVSNQLIVGQK